MSNYPSVSWSFRYGLSDYEIVCSVLYSVEPPDREVGLLGPSVVLEDVIVEEIRRIDGTSVEPRDKGWWDLLDDLAYQKAEESDEWQEDALDHYYDR